VDVNTLLYYKERKMDNLEEGITEAGSMASFIAAETAYATHDQHDSIFIYTRCSDSSASEISFGRRPTAHARLHAGGTAVDDTFRRRTAAPGR